MIFGIVASGFSGAASDPDWANVVTLLHMNGSASDSKGLTYTVDGVSFNNTVSKFAESALFAGTVGTYGLYNSHSSYPPGAGNFTFEMWLNLPAFPGDGGIFQLSNTYINAQNTGIGLAYYGSGTSTSYLLYIRDGGYAAVPTAVISTNTWHHIALVRTGSTVLLFVDGVQHLSTANGTNYGSTMNWLRIGGYYSSAYTMPNGRIDEFRYTKTARYTAGFTPPTAPFPDG